MKATACTHRWEAPVLPLESLCGWGHRRCLDCSSKQPYEYGDHIWTRFDISAGFYEITSLYECTRCGIRVEGQFARVAAAEEWAQVNRDMPKLKDPNAPTLSYRNLPPELGGTKDPTRPRVREIKI